MLRLTTAVVGGLGAYPVRPIGWEIVRPSLDSYAHLAGGKVRDLYTVDDEHLLLVASDRISAYDHVLDTPIPDKGRVLTAMSVHFFNVLGGNNHLAGEPDDPRIPEELLGRALVVRSLDMVPVECVARGFLTGSGLVDYQRTGAVCGNALPDGLVEASQLPDPIFTPASKAALGDHDENITFEDVIEKVGRDLAVKLREDTLDIYSRAAIYASERGIILADTKLEFGLDADGRLVLADEVLTPDSSRYWPADGYEAGKVQPSFDKQFVRNWLTSPESGWDRASDTPPPPLPPEIVEATRARYIEAYERISGLSFDDWIG
ncbi:phosphoribosylaminoimidazole-succinocarboxamide synthase [Rhodococcus triatomae]|uniref:Phosphoribosylaminoimidazole-succinocarboxamide synthase n=1 Tax=Rhodococcus triatomae TaxID=300028 RepID=A0A1G8B770_9NOCA|nr:phosphoribosylaminoimidazole-succinocarboxamide synthase [Rhodococcus triatomae]